MNNYTIHEYIYDKRRQLKGVWAATPCETDPDKVFIGHSLCNLASGDRFDKKRGLEIALGRSKVGTWTPIPESLKDGYGYFSKRCVRYFKDKSVVV